MTSPKDSVSTPRSSHLRIGRWSEAFACYAITKNVEHRKQVLAAPRPARIILDSLDYMRRSDQIRLLGFCIMPDHYHLLIFILPGHDLPTVMESFGKYTARRLNRLFGWRGRFWQDGFHDHRCRDEDDMIERVSYLEHNPVRAELVEKADGWPFSSAYASNSALLDRDWYRSVR